MRGPAWFKAKAGRRDANHRAIVDGLRVLGHFVVETAGSVGGIPDLLVYPRADWVKLGRDVEALAEFPAPVWLELKAGKGKLRESQLRWRAAALNRGVRVATVRTLDEALEALR